MTYASKVQEQAEIIAKIKYGSPIENKRVWASMVEDFIPLARHSVDLMAQGFDEGKKAAMDYVRTTYTPSFYGAGIDSYKHDLGLIKPTTNEPV